MGDLKLWMVEDVRIQRLSFVSRRLRMKLILFLLLLSLVLVEIGREIHSY